MKTMVTIKLCTFVLYTSHTKRYIHKIYINNIKSSSECCRKITVERKYAKLKAARSMASQICPHEGRRQNTHLDRERGKTHVDHVDTHTDTHSKWSNLAESSSALSISTRQAAPKIAEAEAVRKNGWNKHQIPSQFMA